VGWYAAGGPASPVCSLRSLRDLLDGPGGKGTAGEDAAGPARRLFEAAYRPVREIAEKTVRDRERSRAVSLAEEARDLLVQAAYVDLAKVAADGLFAADGTAGFTSETVSRLRRHKVPFSGALKVVPLDGLALSPTDPRYLLLAQTRRDVLERRFDAIKVRLGEVLTQYMSAVSADAGAPPAASRGEVHLAYLGRPPHSPGSPS
jgi:hypothetical protein